MAIEHEIDWEVLLEQTSSAFQLTCIMKSKISKFISERSPDTFVDFIMEGFNNGQRLGSNDVSKTNN